MTGPVAMTVNITGIIEEELSVNLCFVFEDTSQNLFHSKIDDQQQWGTIGTSQNTFNPLEDFLAKFNLEVLINLTNVTRTSPSELFNETRRR